MGDDQTTGETSSDTLVVHGVTEDGDGLEVLRLRNDALETGVVRRLEQGRPIHGDVVKLHPRTECPLVCDVETQVKRPASPSERPETSKPAREGRARTGPAQVASSSYRRNWDAIFDRKKRPLYN